MTPDERRARMLEAGAAAFFHEAALATERAVLVFNTEVAASRPDRTLRVDIEPTSIGVSGLGAYLTATLTVPRAGLIECRTKSGHDGHTPFVPPQAIVLDIDEHDHVTVQGSSVGPELVAHVLIHPFIDFLERVRR